MICPFRRSITRINLNTDAHAGVRTLLGAGLGAGVTVPIKAALSGPEASVVRISA